MGRKVIITIAPTGNVPTKEMTAHVPVTASEIANQVYDCWKEAASVAHIHARNEEGLPTSDVNTYKQIMEHLAEKKDCDIITQLSTGGRAGNSAGERGQMLCLAPEMASLATGSSNFPAKANLNDPDTINYLASEMNKYNIKPEIEVFDGAMLFNAVHLAKKGILCSPLHINLVMGVPGSLPATPKNFFFLYENLPANCTWTMTAIGRRHVELSTMALALGGHIRVGLEDNIYYDYEKKSPATNISLVRRIRDIALAMGLEIATPKEARVMLNLQAKS